MRAGVLPLLERYTTLADLDNMLREERDWVTGSFAQRTPGAAQWYEATLRLVEGLQLQHSHDEDMVWLPNYSDLLRSIVVEHHSLDIEAATEPELSGDFLITFGDELADRYQDVIRRCLIVVGRFPHIVAVRQEDRELIRGWGEVDVAALQSWLREWWAEELRGGDGLRDDSGHHA